MSARVVWTGLDELREQLRTLPADLADDAAVIVEATGEAARADIVGGYPDRTGDLRKRVRLIVQNVGRFGVSILVRNTSPLAHIFEIGTQARHTSLGANRGAMPAGNVFVPKMIQHRRTMYQRLKAMMEAHGLIVTGEP